MKSIELTGCGRAAAAILTYSIAASILLGAQAPQVKPGSGTAQTKRSAQSDDAKPAAKPASPSPADKAGSPGQPNTSAESFAATTANLAQGAKQAIEIDVLRWSTDADRDRIVTTFKEGPAKLQDVLGSLPTVGMIWTADRPLGYSVRFAQRLPLAGGGARIILVTDRPLGSWEPGGWKVSPPATAVDYPFTVIELHVNPKGLGEGKMSLSTKVAIDQEGKAIALEDYSAAPVLLLGVKPATAAR